MAARGSKNAQARTQTERARLHAARTRWHEGEIRRRTRDNTIAGVVGGLIVVAAFASQAVHAQVTAPAPEPTSTVSPAPTDPAATPDPTESPATEDTPSPAPSVTP